MPDLFLEDPYQGSSQACIIELTPPTFGGITGLTQRPNGALRAVWAAASDVTGPVSYEVYIQENTATGLFALANVVAVTRKLTLDLFQDALGALLGDGKAYFVGVRAIDAVGNRSANIQSLSALSLGVPDDNCASLITKVIQYRADVVTYRGEVADYALLVDSYRADVVGYVSDVTAHSQNVDDYQADVAAYRGDVVTYRAEVADYAALIGDYRADVVGYVATVAAYSANVDDYRDEVVAFNQSVTQLRLDGVGLVGEIEESDLTGTIGEAP